MCSIIVRIAGQNDTVSLQEMPPYRNAKDTFLENEILIAESDGKVVGAVTISQRDISFITGKWKNSNEQILKDLIEKVVGLWISRFYVFPEHRHKGVGTTLLKEAVRYLTERGATTAYAGIYVKNVFRKSTCRIFKKLGFKKIGSCICFIPEGYCRGTLLKKQLTRKLEKMQ
jgi:GNAT superfamily N-acetyltransferase